MRDDGLSSDYRRIILGLSSDYPRSDGRRIVFILAEAIQGFSAEILNSEFRELVKLECHFSWQAQHLVNFDR